MLQEAFQAGMAVKLITKIARVVERRIKKEITISTIPVEYKCEDGLLQGFYGLTGFGRVFRINFLHNSSDSLFSLDLYAENDISHPLVTVSLYGFNIIQCVEILAEELDGIKVDRTLTENSKYGKRVEARLLEYTSDDRKQMLFKSWLDTDPDSLDLLQNKRLAEVYTIFIKKDKKYNGEVNFPSFQTMAKQYLFSIGLTNPSFRNRKKGSRAEREIVDKAKEDQIADIVANLDWKKKFDYLESAVEALIDEKINCVLCYGSPGSGKTETVDRVMEKENIKPIRMGGMFNNADELFTILTKYNKDQILLFDDCDSALSKTYGNIMKHILVNKPIRQVMYGTKVLEFTSGVIFLSNMTKFDPAIISRAMTIEISLSNEQMLQKMETTMKEFNPNVNMKIKKETLDFLKEISSGVKSIDYREWEKAMIAYQLQPTDWKDFTLLMLSSQ